MLASIKEFFRVIFELKYIIPLLRYKWPELDSNASLAHSFQETVQEFGKKDFLYFESRSKSTHLEIFILHGPLSSSRGPDSSHMLCLRRPRTDAATGEPSGRAAWRRAAHSAPTTPLHSR